MKVLVDGQEHDLGPRKLMVAIHQQDMAIELPDGVLVSPETTVKCANELEQDQWELIAKHQNFIDFWQALWKEQPMPEVLAKATLAKRHVAGMILLLVKAVSDGKKIHVQYPETYLHPAQCARIMTMLYKINPAWNTKNED